MHIGPKWIHVNSYIFYLGLYWEIIKQPIRHRAFMFGMLHRLVHNYQDCSSYASSAEITLPWGHIFI